MLNAGANSSEINGSRIDVDNTNSSASVKNAIYHYEDYMNAAHIITWVEIVLILMLNGILITCILRKPERNRLTFFVLQLSIADFGMGLVYLLPDAIQRTSIGWVAGLIMCRLYMYMSHVMPYASSNMLVVISLDRLFVILQPLKHIGRGKRYKYTSTILAWIVAMLFAIPQGINSNTLSFPGKTVCDLTYDQSDIKFFIVLFVCGAVAVPALIIFVCYTLIVCSIWLRMNSGVPVAKRQRIRSSIGNVLGDIDLLEYRTDGRARELVHRDSVVNNDSKIMTQAKMKSIIMTFVVVSVFVISWSPLSINLLLNIFDVVDNHPVYFIFMALAPLNSVANPIVFMAFNYKVLSPQYLRRQSTSITRSTMISRGMTSKRTHDDSV